MTKTIDQSAIGQLLGCRLVALGLCFVAACASTGQRNDAGLPGRAGSPRHGSHQDRGHHRAPTGCTSRPTTLPSCSSRPGRRCRTSARRRRHALRQAAQEFSRLPLRAAGALQPGPRPPRQEGLGDGDRVVQGAGRKVPEHPDAKDALLPDRRLLRRAEQLAGLGRGLRAAPRAQGPDRGRPDRGDGPPRASPSSS